MSGAASKVCAGDTTTADGQDFPDHHAGFSEFSNLISGGKMKKLTYLAFSIALASGLSFARPKPAAPSGAKVFVGEISDSMCGLKHMMPNAKQCTLGCVTKGAKFVLADEKHHKVYNLSDQEKPKEFAGERVRVRGTLSGDTIHVTSITAVH
jgi:hypothetical protein